MNYASVVSWGFKITKFLGIVLLGMAISEILRIFDGTKAAIEEVVVNPSDDLCAVFTVDRSGPRISIIQLRIYKRSEMFQGTRGPFEEMVFADDTNASNMMKWNGKWLDHRTIVLNSSDIGSITWKSPDGIRWNRTN